ncbi:pyridoxamine 5'-phosphate oxidase family protein [Phenylobacterium sp.]|uniref:pyridoxamine 5'-phosphate oxidase family protein n=1 Tax=Phenylobacterium sp. TaxID=1871053 RepID=UPI0028111B7C|nr:pyridoxamine 5'-phosphate oxidase family protein [Phenylobacterium sp.]
MGEGPWHAGERQAQALSGADRFPGGAGIRDFMPDQHRVFFAQLPFMVAASLDADGAPTATLLVGGEGFVASPDPWTLAIAAACGDPAGQRLVRGAPIGLLGIELHTRRRNRANGRIAYAGDEGLIVQVLQSFGNCPQYIHPRVVEPNPDAAADFETFEGLDPAARAHVRRADTFFVASTSGAGVENGGVDVSHRGGPAGFVQADGDVLTIPDYRGNRYFNTLGNLLLEPRAALLFVDFEAGVLTQLQGRAEVLWDDRSLPGAERVWRFRVERGFRRASGLHQVAVQPPSTENVAPVADAPRSETR